VLLAAVVVRAALPWALEWSIEWQGTKQLGRVVEVGDVDLAVLPGEIVIEALGVGPIFEGAEPPPFDPEEAHFRSARIEARWSWLALLQGELRLEGLEVTAPELLALRAPDGRFVPVLRPQPTTAPSEQERDEAGSGWPLRLDRLRLTDLSLLYVNTAIPGRRPLEFQMQEFALDDLTLHGNDIDLGAVSLRGPRLRVRRDIDPEPFVAALVEAVPPDPSGGAEPPSYRIAEVSIERAHFQLVVGDRELECRLSLSAREISGAVGARIPVELRLDLEGGWLEIQGEAGAAPASFDGTVTWSDFPLEPLAAGAELPLRVTSGLTSGALDVHVLLADIPERGPSRIDASGRISIEEFDAVARDDSLALAWSLFEIELSALAIRPDGEGGRPIPPVFKLAALRLRDPALRVTLRHGPSPTEPAGGESVGEPGDTEPQPDGAATPRLSLDLLELSAGTAEFVDETVTPTHRSRIRELAVHGRDLHWPERDAREFSLAARGPGNAHLALDASLRDGRGRVKLDLEDLGLASFSPYVAEAAGYWIEGGKASLRAQVEVAGEDYAIASNLALHRLDVAEVKAGSFKSEFGVPLDLALALLRDPGGKIGIPIAAKVEGGQSQIAVASIVAAALRQALVGAVTAPLKGLGLLLGSGDGEGEGGMRLETLRAEPGARMPDLASLPQLAEVLEARPGLGLKLRGQVGPEDEPGLAQGILMAQVVADAELPPVDAGFLQKRRLRRALEDRAVGETRDLGADDAAALTRWIEAVDVMDEERRALARDRATAVRSALVEEHGIAAERIELGEPLQQEAPGVVVELAPLGR
jgi:hypothetical protein